MLSEALTHRTALTYDPTTLPPFQWVSWQRGTYTYHGTQTVAGKPVAADPFATFGPITFAAYKATWPPNSGGWLLTW